MINYNVALDYEDVLVVPTISSLDSRSAVDMRSPNIFASNMDGVGTISMAKVLETYNIHTVLHKFYTAAEIIAANLNPQYTWVSIGLSYSDLEKFNAVYQQQPVGLCIDVANGYLVKFHNFIAKVRADYPTVRLMAGNVCTPEGVTLLEQAGADYIKVGIGPGAACTTRIKTGVGMPQLTAVEQCVAKATTNIIADGGVQCPGDIVKAFAVGASGVMIGSMLAGHDQSEIETIDGKVPFHGMSSHAAQALHNNVKDYRASEGREVLIPRRGDVRHTINDILGGVRSACTYVGALSPDQLFYKASLQVVRRQVNHSLSQFDNRV